MPVVGNHLSFFVMMVMVMVMEVVAFDNSNECVCWLVLPSVKDCNDCMLLVEAKQIPKPHLSMELFSYTQQTTKQSLLNQQQQQQQQQNEDDLRECLLMHSFRFVFVFVHCLAFTDSALLNRQQQRNEEMMMNEMRMKKKMKKKN